MNTDRTTTFLMANLGSEIARLFSAKKRDMAELVSGSAERANKIADELLARPDLGNGHKEVEILKMIVSDLVSPEPTYLKDEAALNSYFLPFAQKVLSDKQFK